MPVIATLLAATLAAPMARADDLLAIYRKAQGHDAVFESARFQALAASEKTPQARAALLPVVALNLNAGRQSGLAAFADAPSMDRDVRSSGSSLQLSQPLYRRAAWVALEQAGAQERQAAAIYDQARQELILRVCQHYFDVLVAQENMSVAGFQIRAVGLQLELARRNFEVGMSTVTDVREAQARYDLSRAQRIAALNELELRRAELERLLGEAPGTLAALRSDMPLPEAGLQSLPLEAWIANARTAYPMARAQEAAHEAAEKEVARYQAGHLPTLDLTASYGKTFTSGSMTSPADISVRNKVGQVGLQLAVPLFSGGAITSKVREALANLGKAAADLEDTRRQAASLARQAYAGIVNGKAQTEALESAVQSSKSAVDANKIGYQIGTRINIDVLNAEQQLYAAQRDLFKSRVDMVMNGLRLKATAGTLDEPDIYILNNLLQPDPNPVPATDMTASDSKDLDRAAGTF